MFDAAAARKDLLAKINALPMWTIGHQAKADELNGVAEELKQIGELVAGYAQFRMADAAASTSFDAIHEQDAGAIIDAFGDCAGQLHEAAFRVGEAA